MRNNTTPLALGNKALRFGGAALLFIALCLLSSCDPSTPGGSGENAGATSSDYYYDNTTNTYHIYTEAGLRAWAKSENRTSANAVLEQDITLTETVDAYGSTWKPFFSFNATFDGKDHTITNVRIVMHENGHQTQGFFRSIASGGVVKNLNLKDVYVKNLEGYIGAIAGSSGGSIENCTASGTVEADSLYAGGIVGYLENGNISKCINKCTVIIIRQSPNAGGIAGYASGSTISSCENYGEINIDGYKNVYGGGIAGSIFSGTKVNSCFNSGKIVGKNNVDNELYTDSYLHLGAIVGDGVGFSSSVTGCTIEEGCTIEASWYPAFTSCAVGDHVGYADGGLTVDQTNIGTAIIKENPLGTST